MDRIDKGLLVGAILAGMIFIVLLPIFHPYPLSFVVKGIPVLCLIVISLRNFRGGRRILVLLALLFCLAGDILLDLDRSANFKPALAAFLLGHIFYIVVFVGKIRFEKRRLPWLIIATVYIGLIAFILRTMSPEFVLPVYAYMVVIGAMWFVSYLMDNFSIMISLGAMIFVLSDTIIAVNKFLKPLPYSTIFNIGFYFTAQILIIIGLIVREKIQTDS
jgi:alkenylglycerophosphocholine hydrolase